MKFLLLSQIFVAGLATVAYADPQDELVPAPRNVVRIAGKASSAPPSGEAAIMPFERPVGECWQDGFFLGDGANGVLAYAPQHLEWTINRNSVYNPYTGKNEEVPHAEVLKRVEAMEWKNVGFLRKADRIVSPRGDQSTVTPVQLRLRFWPDLDWSAPAAPSVVGSLEMDRGRLVETVVGSRLDRSVETVVPRDHDVVAVRVKVRDTKGAPSILNVVRPDSVLLFDDPSWSRGENLLSFEQTLPEGGRYAVAIAWKASGSPSTKTFRLESEMCFDAGVLELFVAVRSRRDTAEPLAEAVSSAKHARDVGFVALERTNADWWRSFWRDGGRVDFASEPEIGLRWNLALFTLAGTYGASPMPGLNGLAYGPFTSVVVGVGAQGYTHDQNAQIPFFAFLPLNRCDWVRTFAKTYLDVLSQLKAYTRERFGCEGVGLPLCMNQDGREIPTRDYRYTLCGSAYSGLVLSLAWRYSHDRQLLADSLYPLLREFCLFGLAQMTKGADGRYHHSWGVPPEIFSMTRDDSATLAMLHTDLETLVEMSELLGTDTGLRARAQDVLAYWPNQTYLDDGAFWAGPDIPKDHYHYGGHLMYPFFPAEMLTDAAAQAAALKTVDYARNHGLDWSWRTPDGGAHAKHEWSAYLTGMARIRAGTDGWQAVREFLDWFGKPNGLFSHNAVIIGDCAAAERLCADHNKAYPNVRRSWNGTLREYRSDSDDVTENPSAKAKVSMVAESTSAFLHMATETVLQSWGGRIRLFPCVPNDFTGSFTNLLAEGGYRVSAAMEKGRLVSYSIEPLPGTKPIDDPRIFRGDERTAYRDPAAIWHDGVFHVYFTLVETEPDRTIHSYVAQTESHDMKTWTKPVKITPKSVMDYSSPGNVVRDGDEWVLCYQSYPRPGNVADGKIRYGNDSARLFTARSKDLRNWSAPELIRVKGPDVAEKDMGRMIDPYLLCGEDGVWRCFYKQSGSDGREGACFSKSPDLKTWEYVGCTKAGENVCVVKTDDGYLMMHSPHNGLGLKSSTDLVSWRDVPGLVTLDQDKWPWARGRLTAGCLLDARQVHGVGSWLLFFHGSGPQDELVDFDRNSSLAVVPFDLGEVSNRRDDR